VYDFVIDGLNKLKPISPKPQPILIFFSKLSVTSPTNKTRKNRGSSSWAEEEEVEKEKRGKT